MPVGRFLLCLHTHMPYVLSHGKSPHGTDWLHEAAIECYLPLLDALHRLEAIGIKPRWTINMTPILAEQLEDPSFKGGFEEYCREKIEAAKVDAANFKREGPVWMEGLAHFWIAQFEKGLGQFKDRWNGSIIAGFRHFQEVGSIEVITSGATHGYQPLLGTDESCKTQVRLGVDTYKKHFGKQPRGIWLPECAYRPRYDWKSPVNENEVAWQRMGTEEILKDEGIEYFFVDSHMIRGGHPLGTYGQKFPQLAEMFSRSSKYFTPPAEMRSEYEHYMLPNGVTCFARDPQTTVKVWSGDVGYPGDPAYLEFHKQLYPGRHRYWRISENKADLGQKQPYDPFKAFEAIQNHAADMVEVLKSTLAHYKGQADRTGCVVAMYDTELFGHWWWEGPEFLFELAKRLHIDGNVEMVSGGDVLDTDPAKHVITLPEGSWGEGGYHYIWLNGENIWTWDKLYDCERKMRKMSRDWATGPAQEIIRQAGRELLLAEASDWQFLISTFAARDYAEIRFDDHVERFLRLHEFAERVHNGGELTAEEQAFFEECQEKDAPFADLDITYWARNPETGAMINA
jgi:1,4-alpha-glucan branching enzyme